MNPDVLGKKYDKIAHWWHDQHDQGDYGVSQLKRALTFGTAEQPNQHDTSTPRLALDVGCGAGGRFIRLLDEQDYRVTGLDVSAEMIKLATAVHPTQTFVNHDICTWETTATFDFIVAWDSLFHLPLHEQEAVISKLCRWLNKDGVLLYTFGNATGEHEDQWMEDTFYYSSIGITGNLRLLMDNGLAIRHLELDQYPERHVYVIAQQEKEKEKQKQKVEQEQPSS